MLQLNVLSSNGTLEDGESLELHERAVHGITPVKYLQARSSIRVNDMTLR
jgi:hypothetical protein